MLSRALNFFTSLWLTVVLLALALILVFAGTLAQVHIGLYEAQERYFRSIFVFWTPNGANFRIPIFPGGWLIGGTLLLNLIAAHIKRFHFTKKKIGILLAHAGLILLLCGQFLTEAFQTESQLRIEVGSSRNYTESSRDLELAVIDVTSPDHDQVVSIPESLLAKGGEIRDASLPFALRVKKYFPNSQPAGPMSGGTGKVKASNGVGARLQFAEAPTTATMSDDNKPAALVEIVSEKGPMGDWLVSTWLTKLPLVGMLQEQLGGMLGNALQEPQSFVVGDHTYQIALRSTREYKPYSISLLEFRHDVYPGTDIPKNFSSKIHLNDPEHGESRDVLIYMNNPLRYRGDTFYQASFEPGDKVSILQVVHNPAAVTPYLACGLVGLGLIVQFLTHLFGFAKRKVSQIKPAAVREPALQPTLAAFAQQRSDS